MTTSKENVLSLNMENAKHLLNHCFNYQHSWSKLNFLGSGFNKSFIGPTVSEKIPLIKKVSTRLMACPCNSLIGDY